jgi:hypothetical protein
MNPPERVGRDAREKEVDRVRAVRVPCPRSRETPAHSDEGGAPVTITPLCYGGTGLSFDETAVHTTGMFVGVRPDAVITNAAAVADGTATKTQGIRPRRPEPA